MSSPTLDPVERRPTSLLVADAIRDRIADGSFAAGTQLTEVQLASQLGVSRGPVREAFQRLVQEGLLEARPHRGVFVVELSPADVADVYAARRAVEREAARRVARASDPAALRALGALVTEMAAEAKGGSWSALADLDLRFHEAMVEAAGSARLNRMFATLLVETRLCLAGLRDAHPEPRTVVAEHRALVKALRSGDEADVLACVDRHLDRAATGPRSSPASG